MFGKKGYCGPEEGGDHESAKLSVLEELRDMAMGLMGDKVDKKMSPMGDDMQQVSVMADDEEGLKEGLEIAKEAVPQMGEMGESEDDMSMEEIEAMIKELEDKKRQKMMSV